MSRGRSKRPKARMRTPDRSDGSGVMQLCMRCMTRKSIQGFDKERLVCAECSGAGTKVKPASKKNSKAGTAQRSRKPMPEPAVVTKWRCPTCLQKVPVDPVDEALEDHVNGRGQECRGSGHALPKRSHDALDYRVPGSFEGGSR